MSEDNANGFVKTKDGRARAWTIVLYDESAPSDWRDRLDDMHIPWLESPLHQYDTNPDGEIKKAHRHLLLYFQGKKTYESVKAISDSLSQPRPEPVADMRGMVRYFIHRDNPEKYQYPISELIAHNGFDYADYFGATKAERYQMIADMMDYIEEYKITEFSVFSRYCRVHRRDDWFPLLCDSCAYVIQQQIKSVRHGSGSERR